MESGGTRRDGDIFSLCCFAMPMPIASRLPLAVNPSEMPMMVFLIHVRDPQFYALPATTRAKNGNIRIMGFPPIGIMSLSAVLKRAGHECVMFDQANPETPNAVIIEEMQRKQPA